MEASCIALIIFRPRSRGKAAGDDEDSMDGTEAAESESPQQMGKFFSIFGTSLKWIFRLLGGWDMSLSSLD